MNPKPKIIVPNTLGMTDSIPVFGNLSAVLLLTNRLFSVLLDLICTVVCV